MGVGAYEYFLASGTIPDPEWPAYTFNELLRVAFGRERLVDRLDHPILKKLRGGFETLAIAPIATGSTYHIAGHLWRLDWKHHGKPFKLPNAALAYDGISRQTKWRALRDLERRGLIRIECRDSKSPIIHLVRHPPTFQS
jgi:hypothetical protein